VPAESLDARHDLPEQKACQVAFHELKREVPGMPDEPAAGLEEPLLEARARRPEETARRKFDPAQCEAIEAALGDGQ
jgi:hypothetical protein